MHQTINYKALNRIRIYNNIKLTSKIIFKLISFKLKALHKLI